VAVFRIILSVTDNVFFPMIFSVVKVITPCVPGQWAVAVTDFIVAGKNMVYFNPYRKVYTWMEE
jgi:hypothetical protein